MMMRLILASLAVLIWCTLSGQAIPREMVLMEIGTGLGCHVCPGAARGVDDLLLEGCKVAVICNHNKDTLTNRFSDARNSYYHIDVFPTAMFDGVKRSVGGTETGSNYPGYRGKYNDRIRIPSPVRLTMDMAQDSGGYTAIVTLEKVALLDSMELRLHFVVTESDIPCSWYGLTELDYVNRKMVPDEQGTAVSFSTGDTQVVTIPFRLDPAWKPSGCEAVVFLQDTISKEVLNTITKGFYGLYIGARADLPEPLLTPNPCSGRFRIIQQGKYHIEIYTMQGVLVAGFANNRGPEEFSIPSRPGFYIVKIQTETSCNSRMLLVK